MRIPGPVILTICLLAASCSREDEGKSTAGNADRRNGAGEVNKVIADSGPLCLFLLDTGAFSAAPLSNKAVAKKAGWTVLPEDELAHKFEGDAVLLNDRLAVVLRRNASGAEVYANTADGPALRAVISPVPGARAEGVSLSSVKIVENNPAAVMVEAGFRTTGDRVAPLTLRLNPGQVCLEARTGEGVVEVQARMNTRYVVVPDYFGDDLIYDANTFGAPRVWLATENFFLSLIEGGDAIIACVWQSSEQAARLAVSGEGGERRITGALVGSAVGKSMWFGFIEGTRVWHHQKLRPRDAAGALALKWKPPFAARWRVDFLGDDELARSWSLADAGTHRGSAKLLLVYPIDRTRATPHDVFPFVDVIRNTLGCGPCQYILSLEGGEAGAPPTPDAVMKWVERAFDRKQDAAVKGHIKKRLDDMVKHITHVDGRVRKYGKFTGSVRGLCTQVGSSAAHAQVARRVERILAQLEQAIAAKRGEMRTPEHARRLASQVLALVGKKDQPASVRGLGEQLRAIGHAQDNVLSKCRMAARRVMQACRMANAADPHAPEFVRKVMDATEQVMHKAGQPGDDG